MGPHDLDYKQQTDVELIACQFDEAICGTAVYRFIKLTGFLQCAVPNQAVPARLFACKDVPLKWML